LQLGYTLNFDLGAVSGGEHAEVEDVHFAVAVHVCPAQVAACLAVA
jgi:hypothetical protein